MEGEETPLLDEVERNSESWRLFLDEALIDTSRVSQYVVLLRNFPFSEKRKLSPERLESLGITRAADQFNILAKRNRQ